MHRDESIMDYCLELARQGYGLTSPNPVVGAALVKDNTVLATGWHRRYGGAHAEVEALRGEIPDGSELYVTLEPCCFTGKTPPCTKLIIKSKIKRVIVGTLDPNPLVAGQGVKELRRAGIKVKVGVRREACRMMNRFFNKHIITGLPYVILKAGMTLDGKISPGVGKQAQITGKVSRQHANRFRSVVDAILVGRGTAALDNPRLTSRVGKILHQPLRVVLDTRGELSPKLNLFRDGKGPTLWVTGSKPGKRAVPATSQKQRKTSKCERVMLPLREDRVDLAELLRYLGKRGIMSLVVEGGSAINASFLAQDLVDECQLYFAPQVMGAGAVSWVGEGFAAKGLRAQCKFTNWSVETLTDGFVFCGSKSIKRKRIPVRKKRA